VSWGREDVIEALKKHEIDLHSLAHSFHPTINEYPDIEDYHQALSIFLFQEEEARKMIFKPQNDPYFEIVTCEDIARQYCKKKRAIPRQQLSFLKPQLEENLFPVMEPDSFCLSDVFGPAGIFFLEKIRTNAERSFVFSKRPLPFRNKFACPHRTFIFLPDCVCKDVPGGFPRERPEKFLLTRKAKRIILT